MAVLVCKSCLGKVEETVTSCPHCGVNLPTVFFFCPKCENYDHTTYEVYQQDFSIGSMILGSLFSPTMGVAAGIAGASGEFSSHCKRCGYRGVPGAQRTRRWDEPGIGDPATSSHFVVEDGDDDWDDDDNDDLDDDDDGESEFWPEFEVTGTDKTTGATKTVKIKLPNDKAVALLAGALHNMNVATFRAL